MRTIRLHLLPRGSHPTSMQAMQALRHHGQLWTVEVDRHPRWNGGDGLAVAIVNPRPLAEPTTEATSTTRRVGLIVDIEPGDVLAVEDLAFIVTGDPMVPVLHLVDRMAAQNEATGRVGSAANGE